MTPLKPPAQAAPVRRPSISAFRPIHRSFAPPQVVYGPPAAHGDEVRPEVLRALLQYRGGKSPLSRGPHENRMSFLLRRDKTAAARLGMWARKVDMKVEVLAAALYLEGYSMQDLSNKSKPILGVWLSVATIRAAVRKALGLQVTKLNKKKRAEWAARMSEAGKEGNI